MEEFKEMEIKVKHERDRAKRLAIQLEELGLQNKQLKRQIDTLHSPLGISVDTLRLELSDLKIVNNEVLLIIGELLNQAVGPGFLDLKEKSSTKIRVNLSKYI